MAVHGDQPTTEAQSQQVPPTLRRFAQRSCTRVRRLERASDKNETYSRGWQVEAGHIKVSGLPDGFEVTSVSATGDHVARVQIREE